MNQTLSKLFPEIKEYDQKIWKFLEVSYSKGWSLRATGKELDINHKTVKSILDHVKPTETYKIFMDKVDSTVKSFQDNEFSTTIFNRYESTLKDLDNRIRENQERGDEKNVLNYYKLKLAVLKDQLRASLTTQTNQAGQHVVIEQAITDLQDEAWEEFGQKIN